MSPVLRAVVVIALLEPVSLRAWTPAAPVRTSPQDSLDSQVAIDSSGKLHVVWRENMGSGWNAWYTSNVSGSFPAPTQLSSGGGYQPVVAANGSDIHFAWSYDASGSNWEMWYRKLNGGVLGSTYNASNTGIKSLRPALAIRGAVGPVIAWDEALQADDRYDTFFSEWNGSGFSAAQNISNTPGGSAYGSVNVNLAISPNGDVTATWVDRDNAQNEYHTNARRRVGGVWQARQEISTIPVGPSTAGIAAAPDNSVHIAYESGNVIYYQRWNGSSWVAPQALPGGVANIIRCKLAVDDRGYVHVVADNSRNGVGEVYYSTNSSGAWSAWQNISNTPNSASYAPHIAYGANALAVVWHDNSNQAGATGVFNIWHTRLDVPPPGPSGMMSGFVRTSAATPVANATISCGGRETISASDGAYTLTAIPVGTYTATAGKLYYSTHSVSGVAITNGNTTPIDFTIDTTPPAPVVSLAAIPGNTSTSLGWTNPASGNFTGTMIRARIGSAPTGPTDGAFVADKAGNPGSTDTFTHTGLTNGQPYYYAAFAHDAAGTYALPAIAGPARPAVGPDFDRDGDVDLSDFGRMQACLTGPGIPQTDPSCQPTLLDAIDYDVDGADMALFLACFSGPQAYASPNCAD